MTSFHTPAMLLGLTCACLVLFGALPQIDLWTSAQFYHPATGFAAREDRLLQLLRRLIWTGSQGMVALALAGALLALARRRLLRVPLRVWLCILALYALGPGVIVEQITKPVWGRARPDVITAFGGPLPFSSPLEWVDHCTRNCAFVSGEAAGAAALALSLWLILTYRHGRLSCWAIAALAALPVTGAVLRIMMGRHFLSDTVLAILLMCLLAGALMRLLRVRFPQQSDPDA